MTMQLLRTSVVALFFTLLATLAAAAPSAAPAAADPYQPLAFLVGHCWKGTFAAGGRTDEHCFSRMYGGKFLRDEHVVHAPEGGGADEFGETIYLWNSATAQLEYLYVESGGGFLRGTATADGAALVFPAAAYVDHGKTLNVRSRWQRAGDDAYEVTTEFEIGGRWVPAFSLRMQRQHAAD